MAFAIKKGNQILRRTNTIDTTRRISATKIQALARGHLARKNIKKRLSLQKLPKEILNESAKFLEFKEQAYLAYTCKNFYWASSVPKPYFNIDVIKNNIIKAETNKFKNSFNNDDVCMILKSLNNKIKNRSITLPENKIVLRKIFESFLSDLNVNATDDNGWTPLHYAANFGYTEFVSALIENGAEIEETVEAGGSTALHLAALNGHLNTLEFLKDHGANVNATDNNGRTALHDAALFEHTDTVRFLVNDLDVNVNATDNNGRTALHSAACLGDINTLEFLKEHVADVNATDIDGRTPLQLATEGGHTASVQVLRNDEAVSPSPPQCCTIM